MLCVSQFQIAVAVAAAVKVPKSELIAELTHEVSYIAESVGPKQTWVTQVTAFSASFTIRILILASETGWGFSFVICNSS